MSGFWQIILFAVAFMPCLWLAMFVLSWRDARYSVHVADVPEPPVLPMSRPRLIHYFTILPLYWLVFVLIWPGFFGARLGRMHRGK